MKIRYKLLLIIVLLIAVFVVQIYMFNDFTNEIKNINQNLIAPGVLSAKHTSNIRLLSSEIPKTITEAASYKEMNHEKGFARAVKDNRILRDERSLELEELKKLSKNVPLEFHNPSTDELIGELEEVINLSDASDDDIINTLRTNPMADISKNIKLHGTAVDKSSFILKYYLDRIEGSSIIVKVSETNSLRLVLISFFINFVVFISIIVALNFTITRPIDKLIKASSELEKSNFKTRVDIQTKDEFQQLGDVLNKSITTLENLDEERKQVDEAKTQFIAISSHELRSPMTPIKAQLQMLLEGYFGSMNKKQKESVDTILRNTNRLDKIIVDLLEVSRMRAVRLKLNLVKTNLANDTNRLIKEMEYFMPEKNIKIVLDMKKLPAIKTDPDRVMQILRNLINNAKKFSPKGGKVFVNAELKDRKVQFSVKDQGIGIAPENQKRIFEPFFQAEQTMYREYQGTGLGLTICKGIVEVLGGKIWFESKLGKGSTFYFTLPIKARKLLKN